MHTILSMPPRINPLRKPKGFEPAVQRWSAAFPQHQEAYFLSFFGVQARVNEDAGIADFRRWFAAVAERTDGPCACDYAVHIDETGCFTHIVAAYWIDAEKKASWEDCVPVTSYWADPNKLTGPCGFFRELLTVPVERQETLYWQDYPAALSSSNEVAIFPTPYCGYYGAMRDRIPLAATDTLAPSAYHLLERVKRPTLGARWIVKLPENIAVIRSATYWGACNEEQLADFKHNLRAPLENGMSFLSRNAATTGCMSLRYQQTVDADGLMVPEAHALGYFLSLSHLEKWAEEHSSHDAIFSAAIQRYRKYGSANQLRTWHEVFVLPGQDQTHEYINCMPHTGLLPWFEARRLAGC